MPVITPSLSATPSNDRLDITIVDLAVTSERTVPASEIGLGFRHSELPESAVGVEARLQLAPGDRSESERMISEIVSWRRANQPGGQNAGSVFVNPVPGEVSAGALIDAAGLRGLRVGSALANITSTKDW